jgi:hypothetical protein
MNIDSVTTTTMLVFSSLFTLFVLLQTTATTTIVDLYSHISILLPPHARTFFYFLSEVFFSSPSLTLVSFQLQLLICVELAMYVYNDSGEEFMYISTSNRCSATYSVYFGMYTCLSFFFFFIEMVNLASIETYLSIR